MTENERIRVIRMSSDTCKTLDLFGKRLGVSASAISQIDNGKVSLTSKMRTSICKEFGVNEHWLLTGEGDMMVPVTEDDKIADFISDVLKGKPDIRRRLISALARLDPEDWDLIERMIEKVSGDEGKPAP